MKLSVKALQCAVGNLLLLVLKYALMDSWNENWESQGEQQQKLSLQVFLGLKRQGKGGRLYKHQR